MCKSWLESCSVFWFGTEACWACASETRFDSGWHDWNPSQVLDPRRMYTGVENAFLRKESADFDVEEFQELGVAFQAAHGRAKHVDFSADPKKFGSASHEDDSSTMLAWKVEVKREAAEIEKITKMSLKERRSYASEERLCFNCLRKGHPCWKCRNKKRCDTCGKKHHTLLHLDVEGEQKTRVHMISSLTETQTPTEVLLMTAAVQIIGENGRRPPPPCRPKKKKSTTVLYFCANRQQKIDVAARRTPWLFVWHSLWVSDGIK